MLTILTIRVIARKELYISMALLVPVLVTVVLYVRVMSLNDPLPFKRLSSRLVAVLCGFLSGV